MERLGLLKLESMGEYEKENGYASYRTIVERFIGDCVLCNNIVNIDTSVYDNMENGVRYVDDEGNYRTEEEYNNDNTGTIDTEYEEIYQYYLCNVGQWDREQALKAGLILSYSDMLDCDVLCVDHYGTSWDYVLTDVKLFDNWEELEKYEKEGE